MIEETVEKVFQYFTDFRTTAQFLATGFLGVFIDNGLLYLFHEFMNFNLALSKAMGTELTILTLFFINDNWTFQHENQPGKVKERLIRSNTIRLVGLVVSVAVLVFLHEKLEIWLLLANMISIGVGFVFNYTLESYAWKMHDR
jgi:putative flippase GtrA